MASFDVDVAGLINLGSDLASAGKSVADRSAVAVRRAATEVQARSQQLAPIDTGYLRSSITVTNVSPLHAVVGPTANYGIFVELGTSRMAAQPFMRPAAEAVLPSFEQALSQIVREVI